MKNYNLTSQERSYYCVPAVLQAILRRRKIEMTQDEIASNLQCTPEIGVELLGDSIREFMRIKGYSYTALRWNETPFNEPDSLLTEMSLSEGILGIGNLDNERRHVFLLEDFIDPKVFLADPSDSRVKEEDYYEMMRQMSKRGGVFAVISS